MIVYIDDKYKIIKSGRYYTLVNINSEYSKHAHIYKINTAFLLIRLIENQIVPKSKYLQQAALRLTTNEKYKDKVLYKQEKNANKEEYYNVNKGVKK